jgi:protein-S-isoprenylcysteine O-methyltransferase Ste14
MSNLPDYGQWDLVIIHAAIMLFFVVSFFQPRTKRDWRTFGVFSAFLIALFTEMYGFPLTIFLLSSWLSSKFPGIDWFSHDSGHLLQTLLGFKGDAHFGTLHTISGMFIVGGLVVLAVSWWALYKAQKAHDVADQGPYALIRHPQYAAFMLIMVGYLIQWPTLPTLIMFPFLVWTYLRLARREEKEALALFGEKYALYVQKTPRFFPQLNGDPASVDYM